MTDKHPRRNNYPQLNEKKHGPTHKSCYLTHTYHILIHSLSSPSGPRYPHPPHCALSLSLLGLRDAGRTSGVVSAGVGCRRGTGSKTNGGPGTRRLITSHHITPSSPSFSRQIPAGSCSRGIRCCLPCSLPL